MTRFLVLLFFLTSCTTKKEPPALALQNIDIPGLDGFRETQRRAFKIKQSDAEEIRLAKDSIEFTLRAVSNADINTFAKAVELREFELGRAFRSERSPYPGAVTDDVRCPESFRPRLTKIQGPDRWFWRAEVYVSSRRTQVCSENDYVMKSVEIIGYCPISKKMFTIHAYAPKGDAKFDWAKWLTTVNCKD